MRLLNFLKVRNGEAKKVEIHFVKIEFSTKGYL